MRKPKPAVVNGSDGAQINGGGPIIETATDDDSTTLNGAGAETFIDPATVAGSDGIGDTGQPKRGRGRPKGSGKAQKETVRAVGFEGVAGILIGLHSMLAGIARSPELELSESEAEKIAKASVHVARLYNIETTEKAAAWANLAGALGGAYIPRIIAINVRRKMEMQERKQSGVVNFPRN